jgi:hypothetical protein
MRNVPASEDAAIKEELRVKWSIGTRPPPVEHKIIWWTDASDEDTQTWVDSASSSSGSGWPLVMRLRDKIAGRDAVQTNATCMPELRQRAIMDKQGLVFDGKCDWLDAGRTPVRQLPGGFHLFAVVHRPSAAGHAEDPDASPTFTKYTRLISSWDGSTSDDNKRPSFNIVGPTTSDGTDVSMPPMILVKSGSATFGGLNYVVDHLKIGAQFNRLRYAKFIFGEVLIYDAELNAADERTVLNSLWAKWGFVQKRYIRYAEDGGPSSVIEVTEAPSPMFPF